MSFKFYDILYKKYKILLEDSNEGKSDYFLEFNFYEAYNKGKRIKKTTKGLNLILNLTKEEYLKIKNIGRSGTQYYFEFNIRPKEESDVSDKNLYKVKYNTKLTVKKKKNSDKEEDVEMTADVRRGEDVIFGYLTDSQYNKIDSIVTKVPKDKFTIELASVDDIIKILKREPVSNLVYSNRLKSVADIESIARYAYSKAFPKKVKKDEEEPEASVIATTKPQDVDLDPESFKFFNSSQVKKIYSDVIKYHERYKLRTIPAEEINKAGRLRDNNIEKLIGLIKGYSEDEKTERKLVDYVNSMILLNYPEYKSLPKEIELQYSGKTLADSPKTTPVEKKEKNSQSSTKSHELFYFENKVVQNEYKPVLVSKKVKLSDSGYQQMKNEAEENKKKLEEDLKTFKQDRIKFINWQKSEDREKIAPPKIKLKPLPSYGIIGIDERPLVDDIILNELSATGGGAPPGEGASVAPGSGEGVATKYAFAKKPKRYTFKNEAKDIYIETIKEHFKNK